MHGPINVKSPNNTSKWQMGINSAFKGLNCEDSKRKLHPTSSPKYELPGDYDPHNGARKHTFFWNTPKTGILSQGTKFRKSFMLLFSNN
jgi:hypothetical protein